MRVCTTMQDGLSPVVDIIIAKLAEKLAVVSKVSFVTLMEETFANGTKSYDVFIALRCTFDLRSRERKQRRSRF